MKHNVDWSADRNFHFMEVDRWRFNTYNIFKVAETKIRLD